MKAMKTRRAASTTMPMIKAGSWWTGVSSVPVTEVERVYVVRPTVVVTGCVEKPAQMMMMCKI